MSLNYYANSKCFTGLEPRLVSTVKYSKMGEKPETHSAPKVFGFSHIIPLNFKEHHFIEFKGLCD